MKVLQEEIVVSSRRSGTVEITEACAEFVARSGVSTGILQIFCRHTSCSLVLMENADPSARRDLERWMDRLVPEDDPDFVHTYEGPDDMPSHIKMALTRSTESVPISANRLALGTWQGIFLWEHRARAHRRRLVLTVLGE